MSAHTLLFEHAKRYSWKILASIILGLSGAIFNGIGTTLIVPGVFALLDHTTMNSTVNLPPLLQALITPFAQFPGEIQAAVMLSFMVLAIVLKNLANYASIVTSENLTRCLTKDLRTEGLELLLTVDLDYHNAMRTGDIIQRLNDQVGKAVTSIGAFIDLVRSSTNILFFVVVLLSISWQLTITSLLFLAGILGLNKTIISRSRRFGRQLAEASKDYSIRILEMLNGIRLVRGVVTEHYEFETIQQLISRREEAALKAQMNAATIAPLNEILSIIALIGLIFVSQLLPGQSVISATLLLTFLFVLSRVIQFTGQLNTARSRLANSAASVDLVYDFLRRDNKSFMPQGDRQLDILRQGIRFDHITFQYPNAKAPALADITLELPKGKTLALVGASGAGKSTLADLLPRFYDPGKGRILVDGVDVREFDLGSLRRAMGIVSQDTFLFNATVRDNIAYGQPQARDEDIVLAAKRANADEFIRQLPGGFDTVVGERGVLLSGGQQQRIAIARVLLQNPPILILDEATSALDTASEQLVQDALDQLSQNRTTLVIAHRLSTIRKADNIAVMEQGRVIELGTHEELLKQQGRYASLYTMQVARDHGQETFDAAQPGAHDRWSHDMRSELNVLLGALHLLADGLVEDELEASELIQAAYRAAINLLPGMESMESVEEHCAQP